MKTTLPPSGRKIKEDRNLSHLETKSNILSTGVSKFDPKDYVSHSKTIKTLGSLKRVTHGLNQAQTTSRRYLDKSDFSNLSHFNSYKW